MFWSTVTNPRGQPTWLKASRGQISWTLSCHGRFSIMTDGDSSIWDTWWICCPRCSSYSSFHRSVSNGAHQLLNHWSLAHIAWKTSWNGWWFTTKCYVVNDGMSGPDWQASINIFAEEAQLEAVASSDIPRKVILSIKASANSPTEGIPAFETHCCQEVWQGLQNPADFPQLWLSGMQGGFLHRADPFQGSSLRSLSFTREICSETTSHPTKPSEHPSEAFCNGAELKRENKNSSFPLSHCFLLHWTHHCWLNYVITATIEKRGWGKRHSFCKNPQFYHNITHMWSSVSYQTLKKRKKA